MRKSLSNTPLQQSEKKLKKGVDRKAGAGYDIAMIKVDNAMNGGATMKMIGTNTKNEKRYLILRGLDGHYHTNHETVSGVAMRDDGSSVGPIRKLRTASMTFVGWCESPNH